MTPTTVRSRAANSAIAKPDVNGLIPDETTLRMATDAAAAAVRPTRQARLACPKAASGWASCRRANGLVPLRWAWEVRGVVELGSDEPGSIGVAIVVV